MKLDAYNKKRIFSKTPEPKGKKTRCGKKLYVIQKHAASHLHYDFRLELQGVLLSWAVPKGPSLDPTVKRLAVHVEDHPVEYGTFEGTIPKGQYGAGTVLLWDNGTWECLDENPLKAYQKGHLNFTIRGKKLHGRWHLIRFKKEDKNWFLIKGKDKYAIAENDYDVLTAEPDSVKHKKKSAKIKLKLPKAKFPTVISPQLCTLVDAPPSGTKWLHEIKLDGYRIIAFKNGDKIKLMSRNKKDWTKYFPQIVARLKQLPINKIILDGEVVVLDKNQRSSFQLLQNAIHSGEPNTFIYSVFDLLYYDQYNLLSLPLQRRKSILHSIITSTTDTLLRYCDHINGSGDAIFKKSCQLGLEGIVSKEIDSAYEQRRSSTWTKAKCIKQQEFVIGGYTRPQGSRPYFGALLLGYFDNKHNLIYCGRVGTGFDSESLSAIYTLLQKNKITKNPFSTKPPGKSLQWVKPKLIAEVEFIEWTDEGILRHPSFKGLRSDKKITQVKKELEKPVAEVTNTSFKFSNPKKILYPEDKITKQDLLNYYEQIHSWILPHIENRFLTLVRCPNGYQKCFYQKHSNKTMPDVLHAKSIKSKHQKENCIYLDDRDGLLALVQLGVLEIHPWGSRIESYEYPDRLIFDLDPAPDVTWKKVVSAAKLLKKYLTSYHLTSFVKTTGGKGLHIVVPIEPEFSWEQVKNFSHVFVNFLVLNHPDLFVGVQSKSKRVGRIFVDYLRNQRGATAVAPFSTRARQGAPVSVPLAWDELTNNIKDAYFTVFTLPQRLKELRKDPWKDFFKVKQSLRLDKI